LCVPQLALAGPIAEYNWNDGTTQSWFPVVGTSNEGNRLRLSNDTTALVQVTSPVPPNPTNWSGATRVLFDLEFRSYAGIDAPSELDRASFRLSSGPNLQLATYTWELPIDGWEFNEVRTFTLFIGDGTFVNILNENVEDVEELLTDVRAGLFTFWVDDEIQIDAATLYLDNFVVLPEPSGTWVPLAVIFALARRRRRATGR